MELSDILSSIGVTLLLVAFGLTTAGRLDASSRTSSSVNACGAGLACVGALLIPAIPFVVLEGAWTLVALVALVRSFVPGATGGEAAPPH